MPTCSIRRPPAIPPTRKLWIWALGPETLAGLEPGSAAIEPDIAQEAVIELGQLAAGFAHFGSVEQSLDTNHHRSGHQGEGPAEGEGGDIRAGDFPHAGQGRHDLAPFEAVGAKAPR